VANDLRVPVTAAIRELLASEHPVASSQQRSNARIGEAEDTPVPKKSAARALGGGAEQRQFTTRNERLPRGRRKDFRQRAYCCPTEAYVGDAPSAFRRTGQRVQPSTTEGELPMPLRPSVQPPLSRQSPVLT
jgi:hypothetical protein